MPIISLKTGTKSRSLLVGNPYFVPSSYESIASTTISGTNFTFTSIPQTYQHLQIRGYIIPNSAGYTPYLRYNGANGTYSHLLIGDGSSTTAGNSAIIMSVASGSGVDITYPFAFIIDVHNYASTTQNKTFRAFLGQDINGAGGQVVLASGFKNDTTAITEIGMTSGTTGSGVASLYGIKGA